MAALNCDMGWRLLGKLFNMVITWFGRAARSFHSCHTHKKLSMKTFTVSVDIFWGLSFLCTNKHRHLKLKWLLLPWCGWVTAWLNIVWSGSLDMWTLQSLMGWMFLVIIHQTGYNVYAVWQLCYKPLWRCSINFIHKDGSSPPPPPPCSHMIMFFYSAPPPPIPPPKKIYI